MTGRRTVHWRHVARPPEPAHAAKSTDESTVRSVEGGAGPTEPSAAAASRSTRQRAESRQRQGSNEPPPRTTPRDGRPVLSVTELNESVATLLGSVGSLRVEGELSGITVAASGHWYFSLKDAGAAVRAVMFRTANRAVPFRPAEGQNVVVRARPGLYEPRGEFQLQIEAMELAGSGDLFVRFQALKERLAAEGLFDPSLKRPLPTDIRHVGIVTSLAAAALHDVLTTLRMRDPGVDVTIYPSPVQGVDAAAALIDAIELANAHGAADVLLLVRGGGSIEDLWSFNDERLAWAVRSSRLPVVSGVGHETDFTIADFVADLRAATPTAAATAVTSMRADRVRVIDALARRLNGLMQHHVGRRAQHVDMLARMLKSPRQLWNHDFAAIEGLVHRLSHAAQQAGVRRRSDLRHLSDRLSRPDISGARAHVDRASGTLCHAQSSLLQRHRAEIRRLDTALHLVDPAAVLRRGYAIVRHTDGTIVRSASQLVAGDRVSITLGEGRVAARTVGVLPQPPAQEHG